MATHQASPRCMLPLLSLLSESDVACYCHDVKSGRGPSTCNQKCRGLTGTFVRFAACPTLHGEATARGDRPDLRQRERISFCRVANTPMLFLPPANTAKCGLGSICPTAAPSYKYCSCTVTTTLRALVSSGAAAQRNDAPGRRLRDIRCPFPGVQGVRHRVGWGARCA